MPRVVVDNRFKFTQNSPAYTWTIRHDLHVIHPVVDVWILENDGTYINSDAHEVHFTDSDNITINFSNAAVPPRGIALIT